MKFSCPNTLHNREAASLLILPYWKGEREPQAAVETTSQNKEHYSLANHPVTAGDFKGKEGEMVLLYMEQKKEPRWLLLGLGEESKISVESLRRTYAKAAKYCQQKRWKEVNLLLPHISSLPLSHLMRGIVEGMLLCNYAFESLKGSSFELEQRTTLLGQVNFIGSNKEGALLAAKHAAIFEGVYLARDLVNGNADDITPQRLAEEAVNLSKKFRTIKTTVWNKKQIEKEKMELLLAVNRGSNKEPVFVISQYKGDSKSSDHTVIVGKGLTFDSGGLNIKTTGMETMKCDMGGAAVALGTLFAAANIELKKNLTIVFPATENSIGSRSYKPGDVYSSYSGKTVEIGNTDAEGRLILADALAYVCKNLAPSRIIDFATLTGAIDIALGAEATGLFSTHDDLANALVAAGAETFERIWRMPLYDEYLDELKSDIADIKNVGGGRSAGASKGAIFLREFVDRKIPWAHCDIASTAYLSESKRYLGKYATGVGVRLMIQFLESL